MPTLPMTRHEPVSGPTLTVREAARLLHVTPRTVRNWIAAGRLTGIRLSERVTLVPVSEVDRLRGGPARPDLRSVLWDVDPLALDEERDAAFIIRRILEAGRPAQVAWMFRRYGEDRIARSLVASRGVSPRIASAWALLLERRRVRVA